MTELCPSIDSLDVARYPGLVHYMLWSGRFGPLLPGVVHEVSVVRPSERQGHRFAFRGGRRCDPPSPPVPEMLEAIHHVRTRRAHRADRGEARGGQGAIRAGEADLRRSQGDEEPAGDRRATHSARRPGRGEAPQKGPRGDKPGSRLGGAGVAAPARRRRVRPVRQRLQGLPGVDGLRAGGGDHASEAGSAEAARGPAEGGQATPPRARPLTERPVEALRGYHYMLWSGRWMLAGDTRCGRIAGSEALDRSLRREQNPRITPV